MRRICTAISEMKEHSSSHAAPYTSRIKEALGDMLGELQSLHVLVYPANKPYTRKAHRRVMRSGKVVDVSQHEVARQGGYIASSFNQRGPFEFIQTPRMPRGQGGQRVHALALAFATCAWL